MWVETRPGELASELFGTRRNVYGLVGTRRNGQYEWKRLECHQECQLQQMKNIHASERVWTSRNSSERVWTSRNSSELIKQLELFPLK